MEGLLALQSTACRNKDLSTEFGEVDALYVLPEKQGGGFGRKLMSQVRRSLRRQGFQKAMLWVVAANQHAIQFYEKMHITLTAPNRNMI